MWTQLLSNPSLGTISALFSSRGSWGLAYHRGCGWGRCHMNHMDHMRHITCTVSHAGDFPIVSSSSTKSCSCFISLTFLNQASFQQIIQSSCLVLEPTVRETTTTPPGVQTPAVVAPTITPTATEVTITPMTMAARTTTVVTEAPPTRLQVDTLLTLLASRVISTSTRVMEVRGPKKRGEAGG